MMQWGAVFGYDRNKRFARGLFYKIARICFERYKLMFFYKFFIILRFLCGKIDIPYMQIVVTTRCTFFDRHWNPLPVNITYDFAQREIAKPRYFDTLYAIAKVFYEDVGYLRCDFYVLETQDFYIGELTFTPGGGCLPIRPREYDKFLGNFWTPKA